jgi:hypothetical protein
MSKDAKEREASPCQAVGGGANAAPSEPLDACMEPGSGDTCLLARSAAVLPGFIQPVVRGTVGRNQIGCLSLYSNV